ncbi:centrosomal protein of 162 kDa-like isoform X2 [Athalia rosae]|uniref:centrosomal protein of 162 kDa-like isoform X2 n=1 Tax=Athalia rosae TaxID=37344 RepID=UPI00203393B2|nr:centrosomal protein of 162 kDa-like isoform X2 [Athalia rosae]
MGIHLYPGWSALTARLQPLISGQNHVLNWLCIPIHMPIPKNIPKTTFIGYPYARDNEHIEEKLISTGEDTLGSSLSLSIGENSIRIKEKPKAKEIKAVPLTQENAGQHKWWLKRPETRLGFTSPKKLEVNIKPSPSPSPDVLYKSEGEVKDKDDTLCDILASAAFDKYPSDFENATDEDIGSILEEMSKIAGALSPNSGPDCTKAGSISKNATEEERSVEELLQEAEKLVQKTSSSISKSNSKSDTLVPDSNLDPNDSLARVRQLEDDIFQMIQAEVHKESEKVKKSPKYEQKRDEDSGLEIVYENLNVLKAPKTLELQRKKFEEQKVEVSSSSDLDDPIERHSKSEKCESKNESDDKDNLQKEITDVDKDFFENLLKKSKEKSEGGISGSSSFGQEDFSHFLRILQGQSDKKEQEAKANNSNLKDSAAFSFPMKADAHIFEKSKIENELNSMKSPAFPEKEISDVLRRELPNGENKYINHEISESESSSIRGRSRQSHHPLMEKATLSRNSSLERIKKSESNMKEIIFSRNSSIDSSKSSGSKKDAKVVNSKNELYTVGLTPRLELFADAIPKLIAEKSNENLKKQEQKKGGNEKDVNTSADQIVETCLDSNDTTKQKGEINDNKDNRTFNNDQSKTTDRVGDGGEKIRKVDIQKNMFDRPKTERAFNALDNKNQRKQIKFVKSKSYDQIPKPISNLKLSLDDVKMSKAEDPSPKTPTPILKRSPILKTKLHSKPVSKFTSKVKLSPKPKREVLKSSTATSITSNIKKHEIKSVDSIMRYTLAAGDMNRNLSKSDWETLCKEERHKNVLLKEQLDSEAKLYKTQIEGMRTSFEEELFALKKHNIILKAKVDELSVNEKRSELNPKTDTKVLILEREFEKQESLLQAYESENKKLMLEVKHYQEEMKNLQSKQKTASVEMDENKKLIEELKDLQEQTLKLTLEISDLRNKNNDYAVKNDDLIQQCSLVKEELSMFKDQLKTKNSYITDQLQAMTKSESCLKKELEDVKVELNSKSEQLRGIKIEFDKLQNNVLPMEREILELRVKESTLNEKLQTAKSHIEREKQLSQKLKDQVVLDNKKIMDLNRQVREMERILKRKNPDSVSALILTANSEHDRISTEKVKLLEERIASLEKEIQINEDVAQEKLLDFQKKFSEMRERYVSQVTELEEKLLDLTVKNQKIYNDMFTQTTCKNMENKSVETTRKEDKDKVAFTEREEKKEIKGMKAGPKSQNVKEDTHLIATIRGLKLELSNKDKTLLKVTKDFQELQKTNRRLQKEREKLLNDKRNYRAMDLDKLSRSTGSDSRPTSSKASDLNDQNSNFHQNGNLPNSNSNQRFSGSTQKLYNPLQYSENSESYMTKKIMNENEILKEELDKINKDFMALKNKRLHDLHLLQEEHEREMAALVKEYSVKFGDSKVVKLQGQINTQMAIISHLKQQIEKLRDYKEQVIVLKTERDHLENKVKTLSEKVKYLSTPGTEQLQLLQDKITILQQRHESREMTLQTLVRDLLRTKTQCRDCKGEKGKTKQLCYFRQELDHILGMLQEIANVY